MGSSKRLVPLVVLVILAILAVGAFSILQEDDENDNANGRDKVTLFVSFIPNVQFAPLYVAYERGYFREEGIDLSFEYSFNEADGVDRLAINNLQFGIISGEQVIIARAAEKPLVYIMEWYHRFPVGVVVPEDSDVQSPADLEGKTVGYPGPFGASYMGLRALLASAGLSEGDLTLNAIGFTAPDVMCSRDIDAAVVYIANEPLTIAANCYPVRVIEISDYANLVSNGLVTNEATLRENPDLARRMVRALQRGIQETIADPAAAFELSLRHVEDLTEDQYETQQQVLANSIELWKSDSPGATNAEAWIESQQILIDTGLLQTPLADLPAAYTNDYLPE